MNKILLIDDEAHWLKSLKLALAQAEVAKYDNIFTVSDYESACKILSDENISVVLLDIVMGSESGMDILQRIKHNFPDRCVVMITGLSSIHTAVKCMELGADDYIVKTIPTEELTAKVSKICMESNAKRSGAESGEFDYGAFSEFITYSPEIKKAFRYICGLAYSHEPILITGESGVGKGVIAGCFADYSRPGKPFISLDVSGIDSQMFSDALFGHSKGAFTGADNKRQGAIAQAGDGVIFLDEIGDISMESQLKLLQVTQEKRYRRLGDDELLECRARLILATNQNLAAKVAAGTFRKDLYYRITSHVLHIPPLRERKSDIPALIELFLKQAMEDMKKPVLKIDKNMVLLLESYDYPGNVRQLRAMVYDMAARCETDTITMKDFKTDISYGMDEITQDYTVKGHDIRRIDDAVDELIIKALEFTGGNQSKASVMIGLSQSAISRRLKRLNIPNHKR